MLRHWIAGAAALLSASGATAQTNWSGFYFGANAFGSRDRIASSGTLSITQITNLFVTGRGLVVVPGTTANYAASSGETNLNWGGQVGAQWQTGPVIFGVEGDFDPSAHTNSANETQLLPLTALTPAVTIASTRSVRIDRQWSIRGRLGYAFGNTLAYATGGYANARISVLGIDSFTNPGGLAAPCTPNCQANLGPEGPNTTTNSNARANAGGWRAGAGMDQRLSRHFSIGLEYLHSHFSGRDIPFRSSVTTFPGPFTRGTDNNTATPHGQVNSASTRVDLRSDAIGLRLNFRF